MNETTKMECTNGVKQGDIIGPILFIFLMAVVIMTRNAENEQPLCLFKTRKVAVLTAQARGDEFALLDSELCRRHSGSFHN